MTRLLHVMKQTLFLIIIFLQNIETISDRYSCWHYNSSMAAMAYNVGNNFMPVLAHPVPQPVIIYQIYNEFVYPSTIYDFQNSSNRFDLVIVKKLLVKTYACQIILHRYVDCWHRVQPLL